MKKILLFTLPGVIILFSCNSTGIDEVNKVTGTYIHERSFEVANSEKKGILKDTVIISRTAGGEYEIKQSGVSEAPQTDGTVYSKPINKPAFTAQYEKDKNALVAARTTVYLSADGGKLHMGKETQYEYHKID